MDFYIQLLLMGVLWVLLCLLIKLFFCIKCDRYSASIIFSTNGVIAVDTTIPLPGSDTATAVIRQNGVPIPGAVFDSNPSWIINDPVIISFAQTDIQSGLVTALEAGVTTLNVDGLYLGQAVHGTAVVTVTQTPQGFDVDITWASGSGVAKSK